VLGLSEKGEKAMALSKIEAWGLRPATWGKIQKSTGKEKREKAGGRGCGGGGKGTAGLKTLRFKTSPRGADQNGGGKRNTG